MVSKGVQRGVTSESGAKVLGSLREVKKGGSSIRCVEQRARRSEGDWGCQYEGKEPLECRAKDSA